MFPYNECGENGHYLPRRHVEKLISSTKIRHVFDTSAKQMHQPSLNDCLEKGINSKEKILDIFFTFRLGKFGVIDIRKTSLQNDSCHNWITSRHIDIQS